MTARNRTIYTVLNTCRWTCNAANTLQELYIWPSTDETAGWFCAVVLDSRR